MRLTLACIVWLSGCGAAKVAPGVEKQPVDAAPQETEAEPIAPVVAPDAAPAGQWIAGDLHEHCAPADDSSDVTLDPHEIAEEARALGMGFVVLTPHLHDSDWTGRRSRRRFLADWARMVELAAAEEGVTLLPGVEYSSSKLGHFTVVGVDVATLTDGQDFLAAAHAAGAFVSVNHPFAVPLDIPLVRASHHDMSYKPWTGGAAGWDDFDAVEVWNARLALGNLLSKPGGQSGEERAFAEADRTARSQRRHVVLVGGSDNHSGQVTATTWVYAADAGAVLAGLRAGRVCVGGPEAGTLEARGDDGDWVGIGGTVAAASRVELRWQGSGTVFVDGADRGVHDGSFVDEAAGGDHTYRIVVGESKSGFVYANF